MLKIPGIKRLDDYVYSIGITNGDTVFLTIKYAIKKVMGLWCKKSKY